MKKILVVLSLLCTQSLFTQVQSDFFKQQQRQEEYYKKRTAAGIGGLIFKIRKTLDKTEAAFNEVNIDKLSPQVRSHLHDAGRSTNRALSLLIQQQLEE